MGSLESNHLCFISIFSVASYLRRYTVQIDRLETNNLVRRPLCPINKYQTPIHLPTSLPFLPIDQRVRRRLENLKTYQSYHMIISFPHSYSSLPFWYSLSNALNSLPSFFDNTPGESNSKTSPWSKTRTLSYQRIELSL